MNGIEVLGWVATGVTLVSMMVKDMVTLRLVNAIGCILWIGYGVNRGDAPIVLVNSTILVIHIIALIREGKQKERI